jgi:hypothetical protein
MKKKLKLNDLQVTSFVTSLSHNDSLNVVGASGACATNPCFTPVVRSVDVDCPFTRLNHNCIVVVSTRIPCQ